MPPSGCRLPSPGSTPTSPGGVFDEKVWKVLRKEIPIEGVQFWRPNAGVLYPAVYELAERSLAAAKAARPFEQLRQQGHRCTQCGEREWLSDDRSKLSSARGKRKPQGEAAGEDEVETVWATLAANPRRRAWAKQGEHLCAVCTAKRLWPTLFATEVAEVLGKQIDRFVVSTHALALATSMDRLLDEWSIEKASNLADLAGGTAPPGTSRWPYPRRCTHGCAESMTVVTLRSSSNAFLRLWNGCVMPRIAARWTRRSAICSGPPVLGRRPTTRSSNGRGPYGRVARRERGAVPAPLPRHLAFPGAHRGGQVGGG